MQGCKVNTKQPHGTEAFFMATEEIVVLFNSRKVQNLQGGAAADTQSSSVIMDLNYRNMKEEGIFVKDSSKETL